MVYAYKYHVVWCPKYRRKVLVDGIDDRLKELIKSVCNEIGAELFELEVMPDHVYLLLEVDPPLWINSYFVSTVGGAPLSVIKEYIE